MFEKSLCFFQVGVGAQWESRLHVQAISLAVWDILVKLFPAVSLFVNKVS